MSSVSLDKLSKKNKEFIHIATHQLLLDGKTDQEIQKILEDILPEILENQSKGITARGLYGAPTAWAASFAAKERYDAEHPKENDDPKWMMLDSVLFIFGFFAVLSSIVNLSSSQPSVYGLTTLILGSVVGGLVFYANHHFIYRFYGPDTDRSQRPPLWRSALIMIGAVLLWLISIMATSFLPEVMNPRLSNIIIVIIGGLALALRFYLKKRFNIKSAAMGPTRY
ncbi:DUF1129 domain-containing protein [Streptococcus panodentis]|uniref:DUF1129 domain-containing protein n=1 Tax=Streptococcus panodentis TaxID=1581472 RepID=A0ABS5AUS6_9STRE|nr:DUF1129 family protein [Streptococcus panodentis]MBP2620013.1 DUF1129 domain-containing protein [Streptococcus panodentis]